MMKLTAILLTVFFAFAGCKPKEKAAAMNTEAKSEGGMAEGINLGNKAPEIALKNYNDSLIKLSSVKGKLVLVDFWASWCGPCRYENPAVVKAYHKYKDRKFRGGEGFTVYSVSLDGDKNKWKTAIEKDGLVWPYHVSDLKVWSSEAAQRYDVKGIPTNVLINSEGIIIDRNLRGEALEKALEKQLADKQ